MTDTFSYFTMHIFDVKSCVSALCTVRITMVTIPDVVEPPPGMNVERKKNIKPINETGNKYSIRVFHAAFLISVICFIVKVHKVNNRILYASQLGILFIIKLKAHGAVG